MARKSKTGIDLKTARLLDANLNRAREGLRVVEDAARFVWDDKRHYEKLRQLRHRLHQVTQDSYRDLVLARESVNDAGRTIKEAGRKSMYDVVCSNMRRAEEAMRVLEEYSKIFSPKAASEFKKIRYEIYQEEKWILQKLTNR